MTSPERLLVWDDILAAQATARRSMATPPMQIGRIAGVKVLHDGTLLWNDEVEINEVGGLPKDLVRRSLDNLFKDVMPQGESNA